MARKAVSCVSRKKRDGEVEGYDYFFKTDDEMRNIDRNLFFNFEERPGGIYGMLWSEITQSPKLVILCGKSGSGKDTLLRGTDDFVGLMNDKRFGDDVTFAIFDQDGVNNILAQQDKLTGVDVYVVWVDIVEELRRERVINRDGNADRADNCWVKPPNRIDIVVYSDKSAGDHINSLLKESVFLPDISSRNLCVRCDVNSAFYITNKDNIVGLSSTPREAVNKALEILSLPHSASGMLLDLGKSYWIPDIYSVDEGMAAEFIWDGGDFDSLMRQRGLICSSADSAVERAIAMRKVL